MAGTSPAMTTRATVTLVPQPLSRDRPIIQGENTPSSAKRTAPLPLDREQMIQPLPHRLRQVVVRPAKGGIAAGEKSVLLLLQGAAGARVVAGGFADHLGIHGVDLAIQIGKLRIA